MPVAKDVTLSGQPKPTPSLQVWPIAKDVTVSKVSDRKDYHLRRPGTSTLWAVARGAYDTMHM